jgi:hypothetical protein
MKKLQKSIRYGTLRIALVDAILTSSECPEVDFCTSPDCCLDLARIAPQFGLVINKNPITEDYSDRCLRYASPELASKNAAEALEYLSFQHEVKRYANDHEAYELLIEINAIPPASVRGYFNPENWRDPYDGTKSRQLTFKRQIAFVLVSLAFPDSYLDHFADNIDTDNEQQNSQTNWEKWCKVFEEIKMPILQLPNSITEQIKEDDLCTYPFGEIWPLEAPHAPLRDGDLKNYVEDLLTVPDCFTWCDRSNGYSTFGGFVVRTTGLFVSQTWTFEPKSNDFYINAFNLHLAPFLDTAPQSEFDHVIVVYSNFNGLAYIASTDPRSWSPNPQNYGVSTPLPNGYGLVDNWDHSIDQYQPRPLTAFDTDLFTPRLRSAARFLAECISHNQQRPPQIL